MNNKPPSSSRLLTMAGVVLSIIFLVGAGLAWWGHSFASEQVRTQLVQEKIFFPKAGTPALDPKTYPGLQKYAGQQVDSGAKAKAYANEYIWVHMMKSSGGKTYSEVSEEARANPKDAKLQSLKQTLFMGDMLRSSLLTAYAFSVFGQVAYWAAIALLIAAAAALTFSFTRLRTSGSR